MIQAVYQAVVLERTRQEVEQMHPVNRELRARVAQLTDDERQRIADAHLLEAVIVALGSLLVLALIGLAAIWRDPATISAAAMFPPVRIARWLGQLLCGLRGHDEVLAYEGSRVLMRCTSCGHDSPGWDTSGRGPRKRFEGDARRHRIRPQIVRRKRA